MLFRSSALDIYVTVVIMRTCVKMFSSVIYAQTFPGHVTKIAIGFIEELF